MNTFATPMIAHDVANALSWWIDMGVDTLVDETPHDWLARAAHVAPPAKIAKTDTERQKPAAAASASVSAIIMPTTIAAMHEFLMTSDTIPDAGPPVRRISPTGDPESDLMVMIDMPEVADSETLLSGTLGTLFDNMLRAIGRTRDSIYIASLCPGRPATGMIADTALPRLADIGRAHVALTAAKMLWIMGSAPSRAITGMNDVEGRGRLHQFNHNGRSLAVTISLHPRLLVDHPRRKASAWSDMQMMIKGMTE